MQNLPSPNQQLRKIFSAFDLGTKTLILGMSRCGKSFLGRMCMANYPRVLIIDIMNEYQGYDTVRSIQALVAKLRANAGKKNFTLVFQFALADKNKLETFDQICQLVFYYKNLHLVIEECDQYCTVQKIPEWWAHLLRRGRHHNISLTMSTQTPSNLNKMCVKQADQIFIGMLKEQNDLHYASNLMMGDKNALLELRPREFLHESMREITKITTNPD